MAGAIVNARIEGADDFLKTIRQIEENGQSAQPAFEIAGQVIKESIVDNFEAQGRPEKWQGLSEATLRMAAGRNSKTKKGTLRKSAQRKVGRKKILITRGMNGGLMDSINSQASATEARIGSPKVYAAIQNYGGLAGRRKSVMIPQREYLLIQNEDWISITDAFERFLLSG